MFGIDAGGAGARGETIRADDWDGGLTEGLRLGHDVRFVVAVVGGGASRIGRQIARRHLRYVETVAINCDGRVQELEEFDRRVTLGPATAGPDAAGSPSVGGQLARAAEPVLERIFEGATFVTVIAALGGGTGTGALPYVLEAASRASEVVSAFIVRPFACEGERRALADRTLARLHFVDAFVEKQLRGMARLEVLDNESLARSNPRLPFNRLESHWAERISRYIELNYVVPAEAVLENHRLALVPEVDFAPRSPPATPGGHADGSEPMPAIPLPHMDAGADCELTFEVIQPPDGRPPLG